jgi:hypothetical protein
MPGTLGPSRRPPKLELLLLRPRSRSKKRLVPLQLSCSAAANRRLQRRGQQPWRSRNEGRRRLVLLLQQLQGSVKRSRRERPRRRRLLLQRQLDGSR